MNEEHCHRIRESKKMRQTHLHNEWWQED